MNRIKKLVMQELATKSLDFWELLARNKYLLKDFINAINELHTDGLIEIENGVVSLTEKGKENIVSLSMTESCGCCSGKEIIVPKEFEKILREFKEVVKKRPAVSGEFYQEWMYPEEVIARLAYFHFHGDLVDRDFFIIGDDDLVSIALAISGYAKRIFVVDIDQKLIEYIEKTAKENRWKNVEAMVYDVGEPLPKELIGKFDVFSSEPLETWSGLKAFFLRGMLSLKVSGAGYVGLTHVEASLEKWRKIEEFISSNGFAITDIVRDFSLYPYTLSEYTDFTKFLKFNVSKENHSKWYRSSLFRIERVVDKVLENPKIKIDLTDEDAEFTSPEVN